MIVNCLPLYEPPPDDVVSKLPKRRIHTVHGRHSPGLLKKNSVQGCKTEKDVAVKNSETEDLEVKTAEKEAGKPIFERHGQHSRSFTPTYSENS